MVKEITMKQTEIGLIPEDWSVGKLGAVAFITKLAGFEYSKYFNSYKDGGEIIVVRGTNITHNKLDLSDTKYIPRKTSDFLYRSKLSKGDLVFAYVGTIGPIYLIEQNNRFHLGPNTAKIRIEDKKVDTQFIYNYFLSEFIRKEIEDRISVGAQPSLSMSKIRDFTIPLPPLPEQEAIAEALSDCDAWIDGIEQLLAKKRLIKQGAMQELLTPKEDWEVKKLGEVCEIKKGQMITSSMKENGNIPVIAGGKTPAYFHSKANRFGKTITVSASGASAGYVGFHTTPIFASDCSTIVESNNYVIEYIFYFLSRNQEIIYSYQTGGAQPHIHPKDIEPMLLPFPSLTEQTRIASILSDMDAELEALGQKLAKARQLKQGMMQELLTGKTRLI